MSGVPGAFEPIAGVSLQTFVEVSKALAAHRFDGTLAPEVAARAGVACEAWGEAVAGWSERLRRDPAVADEFVRLYRQQ